MKFGNLLKKELGEMFSKQVIIGMVFTFGLLVMMGQVMGGVMKSSDISSSSLTLCNQDDTEFTKDMLKKVEKDYSVVINYVELNSEEYADELSRLDEKNMIIIPKGYADSILVDKKPALIKYVSTLNSSGFISSMSSLDSIGTLKNISEASKDEILLKSYGISEEEIERIKTPTETIEYTVNNGKIAQVSAAALSSLIMVQSFIAPMVIFFLLMMAVQMIMTAISTEKIDKTLETLLSTPVSRLTVLGAKMLAALLSALANAFVTMIGFLFYILGMAGMATNIASSVSSSTPVDTDIIGEVSNIGNAISELGISLSIGDYLLFGLQLFMTLAIGLSISLILGAMATDIKSIQTLMLPIMISVMVPWFMSMFGDINTMPFVLKAIMFLIPFTHTYKALTNLMNGDMIMFWCGFAYQLLFFVVCMYLAIKMFTTDKLFTMSYSVDASKAKKKKKMALIKKKS